MYCVQMNYGDKTFIAFYEVVVSIVAVLLWQICSLILYGFQTNQNKMSRQYFIFSAGIRHK